MQVAVIVCTLTMKAVSTFFVAFPVIEVIKTLMSVYFLTLSFDEFYFR